MRVFLTLLMGALIGAQLVTAQQRTDLPSRQPQPANPSADDLFKAGTYALKNAETAETLDGTIQHLGEAIERFREAVKMQPRNYLANAMWAKSLEALVRRTASTNIVEQSQRIQWAQAAMERFAMAEGCEDADWRVYNDWGSFLMYHAESLTARASERLAELVQARTLFEKGLERAKLRTDRASLECSLGQCLVKLAASQAKPDQRRGLYLQAVGKFESATERSAAMIDADHLGDWGAALVALGKLDNDEALIVQGAERLQSSLGKEPGNLGVRFNLVRAYALRKQSDEALKQLRLCSEDQEQRTADWALNEEDLASLRGNPEFQEILDKKLTAISPESRYLAGWKLQQAAEKSDLPADSAESLKKAVEQYQKAAEVKPDYYAAQLMWADCLAKLSQISPQMTERPPFAQAARERFVIASRCPGADWRVFHDWAILLTAQVDTFARSTRDAQVILTEAKSLLERSLGLTNYSGDRAVVERDLAMCLIALAERSAAPAEKRSLYEKAVALLDSSSERSPEIINGRFYGLWGVSLLQVAKLSNDWLLMRQATERLLTALEMDPNNGEARYNLVCAYALLNQPDNALRHLRICLDHDPQKVYYNAAAKDPDFYNLRRTREYNDLVPPQNEGVRSFSVEPQVKDQ